jgi:hypothetical protein
LLGKAEDRHSVSKVVGRLTGDDIASVSQQIETSIGDRKKPIGLLADLSDMQGADWKARWEEMRFLQRHSDQIARFAVVSNDDWQAGDLGNGPHGLAAG